jgi:hypothetical protein
MARCQAVKGNGEPCERIVGASQSYCFSHDPNKKAARSRAASKGSKARESEIKDVKIYLRDVAKRVDEGELDTKTGATIATIMNVLVRTISVEVSLKDQIEIEARLDSLERGEFPEEPNRYGGLS